MNPIRVLALVAVLGSSGTHALPEDREKPIEGRADSTQLNTLTGMTLLSGNVQINQGELVIYASQVSLQRDSATNAVSYIKAIGNPARLIDVPRSADEPLTVYGKVIEFYNQQNLIVTQGDARLTQAGSQVNGERIEYNSLSGVMIIASDRVVNADQAGAQATFIIQPEGID